jgi:hypothetical protein
MEQEKLELKHIAPYQEYNLQVVFKDKKYILDGIVNTNVYLKHEKYLNLVCSINEIKPILHSLSDINSNFFNTDEMSDNFFCNLEHWVIEDIEQIIRDEVIGEELIEIVDKFPYSDIKLILKYKLDIFGFIKKGLAIDINTLKS